MTALHHDLLDGYRPAPGAWDEMVDEAGQLRRPWVDVAPVLGDLGAPELERRRVEAARLLDEDGVTYNVYGDDEGRSHRWALDPVPVVLSSDEWARIERGIIQRAELLDLVLADLYGPRDLLRRGLLPPALVLTHPGYERACDGVRLPGAHQLFTMACDLGRSADGEVFVLGDRAEAPSGAGYALENRIVTSRVLPSLYRDAEVHRLAPFFRTLRSSLQDVAPVGVSDPRIVVLSPGSLSETAFEHAFLASYLGYPLVEGSDLVMRDGRVWMRSLGRLEPVDVILRRVDAGWCDPLELRPESQLGAPGLLEACRLGTLSVVNSLGSGVLENAGLLAYLPAIAQHLLGQPLRLPCAPTWWCGDEGGRRRVLADLEHLVVRPVSRSTGTTSIMGWQLSQERLDDLRRAIEAQPEAWVGQEPIELASVPTVGPRGLEARRSVLRAFVVSRGDSYAAMPGGLTRVAPDDGEQPISNQAGAISKDTWVLASEPEKLTGFWLQAGPAVVAVEPEGSMSSRAAENLFWLGRYAERAEATTRLLRVVHERRNDFGHGGNPAGTECLEVLFTSLTHVTATYPGFLAAGPVDPSIELASLVVDASRPGTLAFSLRRMLDAAYAVRDQLSPDTWLVVGGLERELLGLQRNGSAGRTTLGRTMQALLALAGLGAESMVRDPGWLFMDLGRRIERGLQLAALLRAAETERGTAADSLVLESVLKSAESIITYRRRYRSHAQLETLLDLLLLDGGNPRSMRYQVDRIEEHVAELPGADARGRPNPAQRGALRASAAVRLADTSRLARADEDGTRHALQRELSDVVAALSDTADAITAGHFQTLLPQRPLVAPTIPAHDDTALRP